jgi:hypothetical protein
LAKPQLCKLKPLNVPKMPCWRLPAETMAFMALLRSIGWDLPKIRPHGIRHNVTEGNRDNEQCFQISKIFFKK